MRLSSLELHNFRTFGQIKVALDSRVVMFVGRNGEGKTSVLEAIFLLSHSKSFRQGRTSEFVKWSEAGAEPNSLVTGNRVFQSYVRAVIEDSNGSRVISYGIENGKRRVFANEKPVEKASSFFGQVPIVEFVPEQLQIVKGEPSERRAFLDRAITLIDSSYIGHLVNYQRALKNRNKILLSLKHGRESESSDALLFPWEQTLAAHGLEIAKARVKFLNQIRESACNYYHRVSAFDREAERVEEFSYAFTSDFVVDGELQTLDEIARSYELQRTKDLQYARTSFGVHRDDVRLSLVYAGQERSARLSGSQGQARSIALALKIAALDAVRSSSGESPILLLDDVESELDEYRKRALFDILINECESQVLVTTTDFSSSIFGQKSDIQAFKIDQGNVAPFQP